MHYSTKICIYYIIAINIWLSCSENTNVNGTTNSTSVDLTVKKLNTDGSTKVAEGSSIEIFAEGVDKKIGNTTQKQKTQKKIVPRKGVDVNDIPSDITNSSSVISPAVAPPVLTSSPGSVSVKETQIESKSDVNATASTDSIKVNNVVSDTNTQPDVQKSIPVSPVAMPDNVVNVTIPIPLKPKTIVTKPSNTTQPTKPEIPKKPKILMSSDNFPGNHETVRPVSSSSTTSSNLDATKSTSSTPPLHFAEEPVVGFTRENISDSKSHRDYIIPVVVIIFAIPMFLGVATVAYRRFKDFWSTRHYRRMDFLVDEMYSDNRNF